MAFGAVLDTCVLYPFSLCDLLLRFADRELYDPYWSGRILDELARNLLGRGLKPSQTDYRVEQMRRTFPAAEVSAIAVAPGATNGERSERQARAGGRGRREG
ncbi:MAG TPA: PIN domain-containing protein [Candidatus Dormibacteraeota bacterium]